MDALAKKESDIPLTVIQSKNPGIKVDWMAMAGKDQQGVWWQGDLPPLPSDKEQRETGQLHQKAAVVQKGDVHHLNFTAVP